MSDPVQAVQTSVAIPVAAAKPATPIFKVANAPVKLTASDDALLTNKKYTQYMERLEGHAETIGAVAFDKCDSSMTEGWIAELYFLQQRLVGLGNTVVSAAPELEKRVHDVLQDVCDLQTTAFNRACAILDEGQADPLGSFVIYKNTMKKKGAHTDDMVRGYFLSQAKKFIEAGGQMSDITPVSKASLDAMPDGAIYEYVVDEFNSARMASCETDPTPGHTLLAMGHDALAAGTMKKFGEYFIVGTMSGHFRTPVQTITHMVKHMVAAGIPANRIVIQEGEAGSPRAIEIVHRAEKRFGDSTKTLVKTLQSEAKRFNPSAVYDGAASATAKPVFVNSNPNLPAAAREVPIARVRMQNALREALLDGFIMSADGECARVISAIEYVLVSAECAGDRSAFAEAKRILEHINTLPSIRVDEAAAQAIKGCYDRWAKHVFGSGAQAPGELFSSAPADLRRARIVSSLSPNVTDAELRSQMLAGADMIAVSSTAGSLSEVEALCKRIAAMSTVLGRDVRIQVELQDKSDPALDALLPYAKVLAVPLDSDADAFDLHARLVAAGHVLPVIAKLGTKQAFAGLSALINATQGVVIQRKELGQAVGMEMLGLVEKRIIATAKLSGVAVSVEMDELHPTFGKADVRELERAVSSSADAVQVRGCSAASLREAARSVLRIEELLSDDAIEDLLAASEALPAPMTMTALRVAQRAV